ncbi:flagellar basal-body rod protein FlgG [Gemmobacter aquarius]|uniref:Flagellar basal-body rod protein FlgG n=1 Tax=Paragemmobacter aquarius TaxID=2169400 RepID=A0A2S0UPD7_9RHOB|nr:flagellar basal-body rod protein FlgG [Gemmobacter aquarius]AWB49657.1 flagellar basal-body rod protein FlgG [Gemmobacter aquarius]
MSSDAMHVAKTGLNAQQTRMQVIANNLANVNTTGFKRDRANFETLLYQNIRPAGAQTSDTTQLTTPLSVGTGVRIVNTEKLYSQGNLVTTDNALDVAIDGQGFLQVLMPDGQIGYTRDGTLSRNAEGTLTTASGYVIQPEIQIPDNAQSITISADGIISVQTPDQVEAQEVGQITLAAFPNPRGLEPVGENMVLESPASGPPVVTTPYTDGMGKIVQGALESSNVNVVQELVDMIETQRAYEVNSKSISASDEMMRFLSNKL